MTVKDHYDHHLGNIYSWYTGDFENNKNLFKTFCIENDVKPIDSGYAIDLGAGNGIQTLALAESGFKVKAIDFNAQLLSELKSRVGTYPVEIFNDDIKQVYNYSDPQPELIICCGDTLAHLETFTEVENLIHNCYDTLSVKGRLMLTFRDYSIELEDTDRFIHVKSDSQRILTCIIEYFPDKMRITDLLFEFEMDKWIQKASSYYKIRITRDLILRFLKRSKFDISLDKTINRMITIVAKKKLGIDHPLYQKNNGR